MSFLHISDDQAYRLLLLLVKKGKLTKVGDVGRAVQYKLHTERRE